jgi:hypothetical protein
MIGLKGCIHYHIKCKWKTKKWEKLHAKKFPNASVERIIVISKKRTAFFAMAF